MYHKRRYVKPKRKRIYLKPTKKRIRRIRIRVRRKRIIGRGISRPYVDKREHLMLGSKSSKTTGKQKGDFFPIGPALAAAPPIIDLLNKIIR